jgi:hypothetical protein
MGGIDKIALSGSVPVDVINFGNADVNLSFNSRGNLEIVTTALGCVVAPISAATTDALGAATATSGNGGSVLGSIVSGALGSVGKVWNLPNTVVGVTVGLVGWALGGEAPRTQNNAIVFANSPTMPIGAITLGNVITVGTPMVLPVMMPTV